MAIKDLRIMRRGVDVTVVVGSNRYGGDVTAKVTFTRAQLAEVLAPLEALALEEAMSILATSVSQKEVDERVRLEVAEKVGPSKEAAKANARKAIEKLIKGVEDDLSRTERDMSRGEGSNYQVLPPYRVDSLKRKMVQARELLETTFKASEKAS
jgi:hypothetical protein